MAEGKGRINILKPLNDLLSGDFFGKNFVQNNLAFVMFLALLVVVYIGYGYYADGVMKRAAYLENMEELNSELHSSIKDLNEISLQSNIVELTKETGLKELKEAPVKIELNKE
jgi:hypothetical protein